MVVLEQQAAVLLRQVPTPLAAFAEELIPEIGSAWRWLPAVRNAVEARAAQRTGLQEEMLQWDRRHSTLSGDVLVRPPHMSEKRRRSCQAAGRCVSHGANRSFGSFLAAARACLKAFARAGQRTKGPKPSERLAMEDGEAIVRFVGRSSSSSGASPAAALAMDLKTSCDHVAAGALEEWCMIAHAQWEPVLFTFLQLRREHVDGDRAVLRVLPRVHRQARIFAWYTDVEVLERFDMTMQWQADLWRWGTVVLSRDRAPVLTATRLDKEPRKMWRGADDIAAATLDEQDCDQAAPSEDDDEGEAEDPPHCAGLAQPARAAPPPARNVSPGDTALAPAQVEEFRERASRSAPIEVTREDGQVFRMTLTHRRPSGMAPHGAYQVRCHHHPPDIHHGVNGEYTLACRKEFRLRGPEDHARVLGECQQWVFRATLYSARVGKEGHQSDHKKDGTFADIASVASQESRWSGFAQRDAGARASSSRKAAAAASRGGHCFQCGEVHESFSCAEWQKILEIIAASEKKGAGERSTVASAHGCVLQRGVTIIDVPGDGNCLFHAVASEVLRIHGLSFARPRAGESAGYRLRGLLMRFISGHPDSVVDPADGMTTREWISACTGMTIDSYVRRMATAGGRRTWGGFLEIAILAHILRERKPVQFVVGHAQANGWAVYAVAGPADAPCAGIAWTGAHWQVMRVDDAGLAVVKAWRARSC